MTDKQNEERRKAAPQTSDIETKDAIWENGEVAPSPKRPGGERSGPLGRVADAGDIGDGAPSVYGEEVQAETVGTYTEQKPASSKKG
jgi:hypothetical protein